MGVPPPPLTRLFLILEVLNLVSVESSWCYPLTSIIEYQSFHQQRNIKGRKGHCDVIMKSNCNLMLLFEGSGSKLVCIPNFNSISSKMVELLKTSLFYGAKFCEVPFVILSPW